MKPLVFMSDIGILMDKEGKYFGLNVDGFVFWPSYVDSLYSKQSFKLFCLVESPGIKISSS